MFCEKIEDISIFVLVYAVADVGNNADLYAANQKSTDLINEAHMEEAPLRFMVQDVLNLVVVD